MNMKIPDPKERGRAIRAIVETALPERRTLRAEIHRLFKSVGIKNAFCGVGDAVAAALLVSFGTALTASVISAVNGPDGTPYFFTSILFLSPILYFSLLCFTAWKERMSGTWPVLASCRYNLRHIAALRMMLVSAAGLLFIPIVTLPFAGTAAYPSITASAFCAMFLYSTLTLLSLLVSESLISQFSVPVLWTLFWGVGFILTESETLDIEQFFVDISAAASGITALVLFCAYLMALRAYILQPGRRKTYALNK